MQVRVGQPTDGGGERHHEAMQGEAAWRLSQLFRAMEASGGVPKRLVKDWNVERQSLESCFLKLVKEEFASI